MGSGVIEDVFTGGGEMGALMRDRFTCAAGNSVNGFKESQTLVGSVSEWPQSLKTAVSIMLTSPCPMFIWWGSQYANLYNDAYRPILGASKHPQWLGKSAQACWAEVWGVLGPIADRVFTTGEPIHAEDVLLIDRQGKVEEANVTFSYSAMRDHRGAIEGIFGTVTETAVRLIEPGWTKLSRSHTSHTIDQLQQGACENAIVPNGILPLCQTTTQQLQTEQALRESEARARLAISVGRLGSWRYDPTTDLIEMDARMREIWGQSEDAATIPFATVMQRIHPDDRAKVMRAVGAALDPQSLGAYDIDYRLIWADGTERWVSANGQAQFEGEGVARRLIGFFGTLLDITDRKRAEDALRQSEERYRYLVESIPQLVWTADAAGAMLDVNQRWSDYTGLTLAQAQTEGWQGIIHPDDVPILSQAWAAAQHTGIYYQAEGRMRRVDGVYRWHLHQAVPLKNEYYQVIKWFGTATDIDHQKQLEQERDRLLQQEQVAREAAETANRVKDEFLAVLSHELRSPLNPILGWAKLLQSRTFNAKKTQQALETIERNAKLQSQLVEDLLDVSRFLRGKLVVNSTPVNLNSTIEAALETVRLAAEAKDIHIQKVLLPIAGQVMGESARLQQIVWNLLSNAVKFTPPGGHVEVRLESVQSRHKTGENSRLQAYAQITVTDTGKGISPDFLPHVFEYFRQEDGTTTRKFGGLGLGLAIVRHLTELHGGTIAAESPGEGQGATFTVRFPLLPVATATPLDNPPPPPITELSGLRILIVDDELDIRELVAFILEQAGAIVSSANSALEALNLMAQSVPDVLVCDIGMPEMDGYMLMRQIRNLQAKQTGRIPAANEALPKAIALTAYVGEIDQQQALAAGFQRHLAKPVEPDKLVEAIAHLVNQR